MRSLWIVASLCLVLTPAVLAEDKNDRESVILKNIYPYPLTYREKPIGFSEKPAGQLDEPRGFSPNPPNFIEKDSHPLANKDSSHQIDTSTHPAANNDSSLRIAVEEHPESAKDVSKSSP